MLFTEGGHFTIIPNLLKKIYGDSATAIYGLIITYTGIANILILFVVKSDFGQSYTKVYFLTAVLSLISLILLTFCFREERLFIY